MHGGTGVIPSTQSMIRVMKFPQCQNFDSITLRENRTKRVS